MAVWKCTVSLVEGQDGRWWSEWKCCCDCDHCSHNSKRQQLLRVVFTGQQVVQLVRSSQPSQKVQIVQRPQVRISPRIHIY
jgi:hypothetical protein